MSDSGSRPLASVRAIPLEDVPTAVPGLRFAVRFPDGADGGPGHAGGQHGSDSAPVEHDAGAPHPLAGVGKLFLAVAVAGLAERDPDLPAAPLTIRAEHRAGARSGTLRAMTGELTLTVDDALALTVGTGDGACVLALLEHLDGRGVDLIGAARQAVADLGLQATEIAGLETSTADRAGRPPGESWGEGLVGTTTPADLGALLVQVATAGKASSRTAETPDGPTAGTLGPAVAGRVLGWMGKTFEPAGLASALPGFGPRTMPHYTVSGFELLSPPRAPGCASVLILPADVEEGRPASCVAAYHPPAGHDGAPSSARQVGPALGTLGWAVAHVGR